MVASSSQFQRSGPPSARASRYSVLPKLVAAVYRVTAPFASRVQVDGAPQCRDRRAQGLCGSGVRRVHQRQRVAHQAQNDAVQHVTRWRSPYRSVWLVDSARCSIRCPRWIDPLNLPEYDKSALGTRNRVRSGACHQAAYAAVCILYKLSNLA